MKGCTSINHSSFTPEHSRFEKWEMVSDVEVNTMIRLKVTWSGHPSITPFDRILSSTRLGTIWFNWTPLMQPSNPVVVTSLKAKQRHNHYTKNHMSTFHQNFLHISPSKIQHKLLFFFLLIITVFNFNFCFYFVERKHKNMILNKSHYHTAETMMWKTTLP